MTIGFMEFLFALVEAAFRARLERPCYYRVWRSASPASPIGT